MYTCKHMQYTRTFIHQHVHAYTYTRKPQSEHKKQDFPELGAMCFSTPTHSYMYTHTHTHIDMQTNAFAYSQTYIHTHTLIHTHVHTLQSELQKQECRLQTVPHA